MEDDEMMWCDWRLKEISKVNCRHVFVIFISIKVKSLFWGAKENKIVWKENNYILGFKNKPSRVQPSAAPYYIEKDIRIDILPLS